jgi:hypothetical protein
MGDIFARCSIWPSALIVVATINRDPIRFSGENALAIFSMWLMPLTTGRIIVFDPTAARIFSSAASSC